MKQASGRLDHIDALRGIAALAVLVQHICNPLIERGNLSAGLASGVRFAVENGFQLGLFGVDLFFLVSGFVIPFSLKGSHPAKHFLISRFFRLYPAFWLSLLASVAVLSSLGEPPALHAIIANATMVPKLLHMPEINGVYWTLLIEVIFYAACLAMFLVGMLRKTGWIFAVVLVLSLAAPAALLANSVTGRALPVVYLAFHLSFLFLGTLLRLAIEEKVPAAQRLAPLAIVTVIACDFVVSGVFPAGNNGISEWGHLSSVLAGISAIGLFAYALITKRPTMPWLVHCGATSYSIYLFHVPVAQLGFGLFGLGAAGPIAFALWTICGTLLVAEVAYRCVERPSITMGRKVFSAIAVPSVRIA